MNCRPGDLAVIVGEDSAGTLVRVMHASDPFIASLYNEGACWWSCELLSGAQRFRGHVLIGSFAPGSRVDIPDRRLRPIRDPGDDARDETLDWLPVPLKETQWT